MNKEHLPWDRHKQLWQCPCCCSINAWNSDTAERAAHLLGQQVFICHGSSFDNVCGNCKADIVKPDSPILAEVYTHTRP